jgi:alkylation response protein AidB-like acyl-CoA dehydrogenase
MDLNPTPAQRELVAVTRRYLTRTFDRADQPARTNGDFDHRAAFRGLAELGATGLGVPEEQGGAGAGPVELALVCEELGRAGVVAPLAVSTAYGVTPVLQSRGTAGKALLDGILGGEVVVAGPSDRGAAGVTAEVSGGGWLVTGRFELVAFGHVADRFLVDGDLPGRGRVLALVDLAAAGVTTTRQQVIGGEPRARVRLDGARLQPDDVLEVGGSDVPDVLARCHDTACVLATAEAVGAAEAALTLAVEHAKVRVQFGRPIGSFQAVSNRCADMRLGIDAARLLAWEAAWALGERRPYAAERVAVAKAYLGPVAQTVITNAHQVHGAIGISTEYPLHVFTRLLKAYQLAHGTSRQHLEQVATALDM